MASPANAEPIERWLTRGEVSLNGEIAFTHRSEEYSSLTLLSPLLSAHYGLFDEVSLWVCWGFGGLISDPERGYADTVFVAGNPLLGARYKLQHGRTRGSLGVAFTLPLASFDPGPEGRLKRAAYNYAMGVRGMWDVWLWAIHRTSINLPMIVEYTTETGFVTIGKAALALLIPTESSNDDVELFTELALGAGWDVEMVRLLLQLKSVFMPWVLSDKAQFSLAPKLQARFVPVALEIGGTVNLDEPLGVVDGLELWSIYIGGSVIY